ncbi:hypothetical protein [Amycolatopsis sp. PS_44_ISF1]|uniref:hypothetical protein n=1 Tax=Amycolatopsis sp. PS_44_ISF1 TaxID=2974917 RepID=UPI0028DF8ED6|nr:hypothetical protein [Amycolatopsis sp. PS_44_ISF1]MDT8913568.1 hypothetical protein [Amycolatopsis sp. PS_44_ISF1]
MTVKQHNAGEHEPPSPERDRAAADPVVDAPAREKLTGVRLEADLAAWWVSRRRRGERRPPEERSQILRRVLGTGMGLAILALVIVSTVTSRIFDTARSANDTRITSLEGQVADGLAVRADTHLAERMTQLSRSAAASAIRVRDAQQTYATLYRESSIQPDTDNGAPNTAMVATAEHRRVLATLFSRSSYLADDHDAYTWQNVAPFDANSRIDPRFAWYVRYDGPQASDPATYAWAIEAVMPEVHTQTADTATRARAVWLCREKASGNILAWASAIYTYDGTGGVFDNLAVVVTTAGAQHQSPTGTTPHAAGQPGPGALFFRPKGGT